MIIIRADANEIVGTGHVMRCLSVAESFRTTGEKVLFVTADHRGDLLIKDKGFDIVCLESDWTQMEKETEKLISLLQVESPRILLIDSYYVTEEYFNLISQFVTLAYFDDINSKKWNIDFLINYNIFGNVLDYSLYRGTKTKLLLGPEYAPLRNEFRNMPAHPISNEITDVLVSAGGADPERICEKLIKEVCPCWQNVRFHVVVGALNPRIDYIKALSGNNIILHINEKKMSELMKMCDVAIAAAGTTLYELCATGIPAITYILADNQIIAAEQFSMQGIMLNAGDCRGDNLFTDRLGYLLRELAGSQGEREKYSEKMQKLVDGRGADRIAEALLRGNNSR